MAVSIDESVLLFLAGAIFIPLIIFMVKLVVDVGIIKGNVALLQKQIERMDEDSKISGGRGGVRR